MFRSPKRDSKKSENPPSPGLADPVPKSKWKAFAPRLANGDVLLFASTKAGIDVFHCGLLALSEGKRKLRHASRSAGSVVEQDLAAFLRANRTAGLVALRPLDPEAGP